MASALARFSAHKMADEGLMPLYLSRGGHLDTLGKAPMSLMLGHLSSPKRRKIPPVPFMSNEEIRQSRSSGFGSERHCNAPAFHRRTLFDLSHLLEAILHLFHKLMPEFGVAHLASPKEHIYQHLVLLFKEATRASQFDLEVVLLGLRP